MRAGEFAFTASEPEQLAEEILALVSAIRAIAELDVVGEPGPHNNLDAQVGGDYFRLHELLAGPLSIVASAMEPGLGPVRDPGPAWLHLEQFREAVQLARTYCNVQREALLNKLARGYQKPDFCIKRDAVGPARDSLLPTTLSWDADWYFGKIIDLPDRE